MITITAILNAIEAHAERAIVPELRLIKKEVEKLRPSLYRMTRSTRTPCC